MKKNLIALTLAAALAFVVAGCSQESSAPAPAAAPSMAPATVAALGTPPKVGVVSEVVEGDGMSYVLMVNGDNNYWIAAPQIALNVGEQIAISTPTEKTAYKSEALDRTFDKIFFVDTLMPKSAMGGGMGGGMSGSMGGSMGGGNPHGSSMPASSQSADVAFDGIEKPADGYTVSELFGKSAELNGQSVNFRGKVVKFSRGIMGANWAHIQDGTGEAGTNDITVTTQGDANVGDTVLVTGTLEKDVDIGSGYFFPVIFQNAQLVVE